MCFQLFNAMQVPVFQYDTFRRHARMFIEPAVVHMWKTSQDSMLQQLRQDEKVVVGCDTRTDSPGVYILVKFARGKVQHADMEFHFFLKLSLKNVHALC